MAVHISERESIRDVAERYTRAGLSVLPIRADGTKAPAISSWTQLQSRIGTSEELDRWLKNGLGIGVIGGRVSGNLEILDFDQPGIFHRFIAEVEVVAPGLIDRLPQVATPGDGNHAFLRCSEIENNQKLAMSADHQVLIETRGQGGYVVAPGSPARCHASGRIYRHVGGPAIENVPTITPEERNTLLRVARSFDERSQEQRQDRQEPTAPKQRDGLSPGDDFAAKHSWAEVLEPYGWIQIAKDLWRRPGKDSGGPSASTSTVSKNGNALLRVFSSNAFPFDSDESYTKFAAYTILGHKGDFAAAARALGGLGYGCLPTARTSVNRPVNSSAEMECRR